MTLNNKICKNIICLFSVFICFTYSGQAQKLPETSPKEKSDFWKKVRFGGGFGLDVTNGFFGITLAPSAIYQFNNKLSLGAGLNGAYNSQRNGFKSTILGGNLIGLYNVFRGFQLSTELEQLHVNRNIETSTINVKNNFWTTGLLVGAGYRQGNATFGVRYNLLHDDDSIYSTALIPFARFYF